MDGEVGSSWLLFVLLFVGTVLPFRGEVLCNLGD